MRVVSAACMIWHHSMKNKWGRETMLTRLVIGAAEKFSEDKWETSYTWSLQGQQTRQLGVRGERKTFLHLPWSSVPFEFWILSHHERYCLFWNIKFIEKNYPVTFILRISAFLTSLSSFSFVIRCCKEILEALPSSISCSCVSRNFAKCVWKCGGVLGL